MVIIGVRFFEVGERRSAVVLEFRRGYPEDPADLGDLELPGREELGVLGRDRRRRIRQARVEQHESIGLIGPLVLQGEILPEVGRRDLVELLVGRQDAVGGRPVPEEGGPEFLDAYREPQRLAGLPDRRSADQPIEAHVREMEDVHGQIARPSTW